MKDGSSEQNEKRFIVLYNGTKQTEEKTVLKLSDAYRPFPYYEARILFPDWYLLHTIHS